MNDPPVGAKINGTLKSTFNPFQSIAFQKSIFLTALLYDILLFKPSLQPLPWTIASRNLFLGPSLLLNNFKNAKEFVNLHNHWCFLSIGGDRASGNVGDITNRNWNQIVRGNCDKHAAFRCFSA